MKEILVLGGGASGLAAAIAAAQAGGSRVRVTLLEQNPAPGKKLLATGNGRCNFDNLASSEPGRYFTAAPSSLAGLLAAIDGADATKSSKCNRRIKENFSRGFPTQAFSWAGID